MNHNKSSLLIAAVALGLLSLSISAFADNSHVPVHDPNNPSEVINPVAPTSDAPEEATESSESTAAPAQRPSEPAPVKKVASHPVKRKKKYKLDPSLFEPKHSDVALPHHQIGGGDDGVFIVSATGLRLRQLSGSLTINSAGI